MAARRTRRDIEPVVSNTEVVDNPRVDLSQAVSSDKVKALEAVRDSVVADLEVCSTMRDRAALYLRLLDVMARLDEARPAETEGDPVDEIAQKRSNRRAGGA